jgi:hypothetical protein
MELRLPLGMAQLAQGPALTHGPGATMEHARFTHRHHTARATTIPASRRTCFDAASFAVSGDMARRDAGYPLRPQGNCFARKTVGWRC